MLAPDTHRRAYGQVGPLVGGEIAAEGIYYGAPGGGETLSPQIVRPIIIGTVTGILITLFSKLIGGSQP